VSEIAEALSCQELVELVTDYLDGALSPRDRQRFDEHIAACDDCRAYLDQIRVTIRMTGSLVPEQLDPAAETALLEAFRDWKSGKT
jgi:anti-sigma factor RsiW